DACHARPAVGPWLEPPRCTRVDFRRWTHKRRRSTSYSDSPNPPVRCGLAEGARHFSIPTSGFVEGKSDTLRHASMRLDKFVQPTTTCSAAGIAFPTPV